MRSERCSFHALRHASSINAGKKLTITTPSFFAMARIISSVRLRGAAVSARTDECEAMIGDVDVLITSQNVLSETCDTSTIIPNRFISRTTSRPNSLNPLWWGTLASPRSPEESAHSFEFDQVSVIYRTPSV